MIGRLREEFLLFLLALQFLTRLPLPAELAWSADRFSRTPRWYPAVGALVGGLQAVFWFGAAMVFPPTIAAILTVASALLLTGAFHEDGFADAVDGLGGGTTREHVLEIMRDSRIGTYGAAALGLALALKIACLAVLPAAAVPAVLIATEAASRAASVEVIATGRYLRDSGIAKPVANGLDADGLRLARASAGLALLPALLVLPATASAAALVGLLLGYAATRRAFERRLGGYTGDCLGAVQQAALLGFLLGAVAGSRAWAG